MTAPYSGLTKAFEAHTLDPDVFGHLEHVQVAYEMLQRYDFLEVSERYSRAINSIATRAGAPEKFNLTITLAFLSLIAERVHDTEHSDFEEFLALNEDLKSGSVLNRWYSREVLASDFARTHFALPDRVA